MAEEADGDLRENRFSYLLQPIRDLAANWDINIAGELEEYLEELESLTFAMEGCGPSLNFAEAALLIQGTTCVYSKKVEYLHNLVYQALETIFNKRQKEKAGGRKGAKTADVDGEGGGDDGNDTEAFLCLDDVVHEAQDIDLEEDDGAGTTEVLRPPTALLALEDGQAQAGDGDAGGFRLAQCAVHTSGALLLELKDGDLYDAHLRRCMRPPVNRLQQGRQGQQGGQEGGAVDDIGAGEAAGAFDDEDCGGGWDEDGGGGDWDGDDGGDIDLPDALPMGLDGAAGGSFAGGEPMVGVSGIGMDLEAEVGGLEGPGVGVPDWMQQDGAQGSGVAAAAGQQAGPSGSVPGVATRHQQQQQQQEQQQQEEAPVYFDPYAPLDHSDGNGLPLKPLKARKPKRKATLPQQQTGTGTGPPLTGAAAQLFFPEFAYLLEAVTAAKRAAQAAQRPARAGRRGGASVMDWGDAAAAAQADGEVGVGGDGAAGPLGWDGDDGGGAGAESDGYDYGGDDGDAGYDDQGALQELEEAAAAGGSWLGIGVGAAGGGGEEGELSYEELCRAHIDTLIAAAAAQQHQSELQVRVATWRQRIDPILQAEEDRSAFDIHHYGERIIDRLDNLKLGGGDDAGSSRQQQQQQGQEGDVVVEFKEVVAAVDRFEVSRLFSAMLQLINNRNVAIIKHGPPEAPFDLQLLSAAMPHKSMGDHLPLGAGAAAAAKDGMEVDASQSAGGVENQRQLANQPPTGKPAAKKARKAKAVAA